ncbi:hypothetical protein Tco_0688434 [Tanacetum coccineum]
MHINNDVCSHQFRPRSSMINDVCSHQFRPRSSMTNDVYSHQFRPRSSMTNDVCSHQFRPRSSMKNDVCSQSVQPSSSHYIWHSADNTSGPFPKRKKSGNLRLGHQLMTPGPISSGLVPQPPSPTPNVPPTKNDRDTLFCPMFDEYFNPSPSVAQPVLEVLFKDIPSTRFYTSSLLNAACKKYLNLLKKGLLVQGKLRQLTSGEYRDELQIANMYKMTVPLSV